MNIGIIGSGTMGLGIAQCFSEHNYVVKLCSRNIDSASKGKKRLIQKISKRVELGKISKEESDNILNRIIVSEIESCSDCDLVFECAPENLETKKELLTKIDKICKDDCIIASNTSSFSITELQSYIKHHVIGVHFFNPAQTMKLVEIIPGIKTPSNTIEVVKNIVIQLDKDPIIVKESPGFVVNRLLIPMINDAIQLYENSVSSLEEIDLAMKLGANHPMGPIELADFIGLDVCKSILDVLYNETGNPRFMASSLLKRMVKAGYLGRKTGKGFYEYN